MAKLYFRYAAMNAGKSTQALQVTHNYESLGKMVMLMTAEVDGRFGEGQITSRLGVSRAADCFNDSTDMFVAIEQFRQDAGDRLGAVLIDEAQFLSSEQVRQIHKAVHQLGVPVLCYGLRTDFRGQPFAGSTMLLALAESLEEIKNVCSCGRKATMNIRCDAEGKRLREGPQILIGDANYRQACACCFYTD